MSAALFHKDPIYSIVEGQPPEPLPALFIDIGTLVPTPGGHTYGKPGGLPRGFMEPAVVARISVRCNEDQRRPVKEALMAAVLPSVTIEQDFNDRQHSPNEAREYDFQGVIFIVGDIASALRAMAATPHFSGLVDETNMRLALETADRKVPRELLGGGPLLQANRTPT